LERAFFLALIRAVSPHRERARPNQHFANYKEWLTGRPWRRFGRLFLSRALTHSPDEKYSRKIRPSWFFNSFVAPAKSEALWVALRFPLRAHIFGAFVEKFNALGHRRCGFFASYGAQLLNYFLCKQHKEPSNAHLSEARKVNVCVCSYFKDYVSGE
jgi:hypothetical protein